MNGMHSGGFVYVQTNDADNNEVVVFKRASDGRLERLDSYLTGGRGPVRRTSLRRARSCSPTGSCS